MAQVNLEECRKAGNVYRTNLEQLYIIEQTMGEEAAGKFAKALVETVLCGHASESNPIFESMLLPTRDCAVRDRERYEEKVARSAAAKIEKLQLQEIADMLAAGRTQRDIAAELKIAPSTLSWRISTIRSDFPHLLKDNASPEHEEEGVEREELPQPSSPEPEEEEKDEEGEMWRVIRETEEELSRATDKEWEMEKGFSF